MAIQERRYKIRAERGGVKDTPLVRAGGVKNLAMSIRRVNDKELSEKMREASKHAAEAVASTAKGMVPRGDTKKLLNSIRASATRTQGRIHAGNKYKNRRGVPYARAVHSGKFVKATGQRTKGNPFIRKAVPKAWSRVVDRYTDAMNEIAKEFNRKHGVDQVKGKFRSK